MIKTGNLFVLSSIIILLICSSSQRIHENEGINACDYVDPFIGADYNGNTFPGPCLPFGMVKLSPDCGKLNTNSGYKSGVNIRGFSHTHVSGTGGGAKYGNVMIMPVKDEINPDDFASSGIDETANAGYYSTFLTRYGIKAEITSSHSV